jgi:hypothetical protein
MPKPLWDEWLGRKITWRLQSRILPHLRRNQEIWGETIREYLTHPVRWMDAGCGWHLLLKDLEQLENELLNLAGIVVGVDLDFPHLRKHVNISGCATWKGHLAGFLFLWHHSERLYTYRLVAL